MRRRLISILGYYGFGNTGDEAILHCMLTQLRAMKTGSLEFDVVVFSGDPNDTTRMHGVPAVASALPSSLKEIAVRIVGRSRAEFVSAVKTLLKSDTLIVGGGGLFFDQPEYNLWLKKLLIKIMWAKRLGKRVIIFGVGVGPLHWDDSRDMLRRCFSMVDLITVRDEVSRQLLVSLGVSGPPIVTTGDFVFLLQPASSQRVNEIIERESLPLRGAPRIGVSVFGDQIKMPLVKETITEFCRYAISKLGADIWFIPMQTGGFFDDRVGAREIADAISQKDKIFMIEGVYTPWESMGLMKHVDAILGVRLHSIVLAVNNATPVFGISYAQKVERLFHEMGHPDWQVTTELLSPQSVIDGFDKIWQDRNQISDELRKISGELRESAMANFSSLAEVLVKETERQ